MRIELENENKDNPDSSSEFAELVKNQGDSDKESTKQAFSELSTKKKIGFIWDYYKWWIIGTIVAVVLVVSFVRSYRENSKPVYIAVEMINTYLGTDPDNPVEEDFIKEAGIDTEVYNTTFGFDMYLSNELVDNSALAYQERLVAENYAGSLDVTIGPVYIMEHAANCDNYANLGELLPKDLVEELKDREYEFYYFDPAADDIEDYEDEDLTPYFAGVYLDTCSYLNNVGQNGAYPVAENDDEKVIFTITGNTQNAEHAIEFLRFLIHNR